MLCFFFTLKIAPHRRASVVFIKKTAFSYKIEAQKTAFSVFQTTPCASMARATFRNPATFAPFT